MPHRTMFVRFWCCSLGSEENVLVDDTVGTECGELLLRSECCRMSLNQAKNHGVRLLAPKKRNAPHTGRAEGTYHVFLGAWGYDYLLLGSASAASRIGFFARKHATIEQTTKERRSLVQAVLAICSGG